MNDTVKYIKKYSGYLILLAVLLMVFLFSKKFEKIIIPFLFGIMIAFLFRPLVKRMIRRGIPKKAAVSIAYAWIVFSLAACILYIVPAVIKSAVDLTRAMPSIIDSYANLIYQVGKTVHFDQWPKNLQEIVLIQMNELSQVLKTWIINYMQNGVSILQSCFFGIMDILLALLISYYLIKDDELMKALFIEIFPKRYNTHAHILAEELSRTMTDFFTGQFITAIIVGTMEFIGLYFLNIRFSFLLGIIGGFFNMVPYFGPFIGAVPAILLALTDSPIKALWVTLLFIVVQQIDNNFISTKIIEGKLGIHPLSTIAAILIGGEFFGILGMFLSVPVVAVLYRVAKKLYSDRART